MHVTGIDLSRNNITIAKEKENKTLQFKIWDMRDKFKKTPLISSSTSLLLLVILKQMKMNKRPLMQWP